MRDWRLGKVGGWPPQCGIFSSVVHGVQVLGGRAGGFAPCRCQLPVRQPARSALLDWRRGRRKDTPLNWSLTMPNIPGASAPPPARCKVSTASPLTESPPWPCRAGAARRTQQGAPCRQRGPAFARSGLFGLPAHARRPVRRPGRSPRRRKQAAGRRGGIPCNGTQRVPAALSKPVPATPSAPISARRSPSS